MGSQWPVIFNLDCRELSRCLIDCTLGCAYASLLCIFAEREKGCKDLGHMVGLAAIVCVLLAGSKLFWAIRFD